MGFVTSQGGFVKRTAVAMLSVVLILSVVNVAESSEDWAVYEDATMSVTVRYENEENMMTVTFPKNVYPIANGVAIIKHENIDNRILYDNMLIFYVDKAVCKAFTIRFGTWDNPRNDIGGIGWVDSRDPSNAGSIDVDTSSPVVVINEDTVNRTLYFAVAGPTGTKGDITLRVTKNLIASPDNVKGYLDNQSINLAITENGDYYNIKAEYTRSVHTLMIDFGPMPTSPWYAQPLNIAIMGIVIIVIALVAVYWLKFRR
jgi:hypothetical protein